MTSKVQSFLSITVGLLISGIAGEPAKAATVTLATFNGDTTNAPTWTRPNADGTSSSVTVAYSVQSFSVDTTGLYDFLSDSRTPINPVTWDNYTFLYKDSFNPSQPTGANFVQGNDDFPTTGLSGFTGVSLIAKKQYFFVTTGFDIPDKGKFSNTISGLSGSKVTLGPTGVPFEFSPVLGLSILGAWFGVSQLKSRTKK